MKLNDKILLGILGYGKRDEYYWALRDDIASCVVEEVSLVYLDNKRNVVGGNLCSIKDIGDCNANLYYEFTGYLMLLEEFIKIDAIQKYAKVILLNDTATSHHNWKLWKHSIVGASKIIPPHCVIGDLRFSRSSIGDYNFIASWMFVFSVSDLCAFRIALLECLNSVTKNKNNYFADTIHYYGLHLDKVRRKKLVEWLFSDNKYHGWIQAKPFEEMPKEVRYRKGVAIELEHNFSNSLSTRNFNLLDIKRISIVAYIANKHDRLLNLYLRLVCK